MGKRLEGTIQQAVDASPSDKRAEVSRMKRRRFLEILTGAVSAACFTKVLVACSPPPEPIEMENKDVEKRMEELIQKNRADHDSGKIKSFGDLQQRLEQFRAISPVYFMQIDSACGQIMEMIKPEVAMVPLLASFSDETKKIMIRNGINLDFGHSWKMALDNIEKRLPAFIRIVMMYTVIFDKNLFKTFNERIGSLKAEIGRIKDRLMGVFTNPKHVEFGNVQSTIKFGAESIAIDNYTGIFMQIFLTQLLQELFPDFQAINGGKSVCSLLASMAVSEENGKAEWTKKNNTNLGPDNLLLGCYFASGHAIAGYLFICSGLTFEEKLECIKGNFSDDVMKKIDVEIADLVTRSEEKIKTLDVNTINNYRISVYFKDVLGLIGKGESQYCESRIYLKENGGAILREAFNKPATQYGSKIFDALGALDEIMFNFSGNKCGIGDFIPFVQPDDQRLPASPNMACFD
ncbi:hypothetical protein KKG71_07070 [Patescibacteria group bacterium]|nr:hypothetical protein [Patescibacteria group bacterium]